MGELSLSAMGRLIKKAGAHRVSESAKIALREILEEFANEIAERAVKLAKHAKRTTVNGKDIKLAAKT